MNIIFKDSQHRQYYEDANPRDSYERALHYLIGLCPDTRRNAHRLYDKENKSINPEAINDGWQTSGSVNVTRLAFNLYTDGTPTAPRIAPNGEDFLPVSDEDLGECTRYSPSDLFCCEYASYFFEAIKLRYPEYCRDIQPQKNSRDNEAR